MQIISRNNSAWILRFDPGEELITGLAGFAETHEIAGATFSGIGALSRAVLSFFDLQSKSYQDRDILQPVELVSFSGNVSRAETGLLVHAHGCVAGSDHIAYGGHFKQAVVSVTAEIRLDIAPGVLGRKMNSEFGLALLQE